MAPLYEFSLRAEIRTAFRQGKFVELSATAQDSGVQTREPAREDAGFGAESARVAFWHPARFLADSVSQEIQ
jgi:hypothetical protein